MMILTYLQHDHPSPKTQLAKYFVDEVIEIFSPDKTSHSTASAHWPESFDPASAHAVPSSAFSSPDRETLGVWSFIKKLRARAGAVNGSRPGSHDDFSRPGPASNSVPSARKLPSANGRPSFDRAQQPAPLKPHRYKTAASNAFGGAFATQAAVAPVPQENVGYWSGRDVEEDSSPSAAPDFEACFTSLLQDADEFMGDGDLTMKESFFDDMLTDLNEDPHDSG